MGNLVEINRIMVLCILEGYEMELRERNCIKVIPNIALTLVSCNAKGIKSIDRRLSKSDRRKVSRPNMLSKDRRQYKSIAYDKRKELTSTRREWEKLGYQEKLNYEVEWYENRIELIESVHKECHEALQWDQIYNSFPPFIKGSKGSRESEAEQAFINYEPSWLHKLFKKDDKVRKMLVDNITLARAEDQMEYEEWEQLYHLSAGVMAGRAIHYNEVIKQMAPLEDLTGFGSSFEYNVINANLLEVEFDVNLSQVIPIDIVSMANNGRLSIVPMSKAQIAELEQEYLCSGALRIAREMFALLPIEHVLVHAMDTQLNTIIGKEEYVTIASIQFDRKTLSAMNFDEIDCTEVIDLFPNRKKFKKASGYFAVEKLRVNS